MTLAVRGLVEVDERDENLQPDAREPALARPPRHLLQVEAGQELDLDEHCQVVEEPVECEKQPSKDLQVLLSRRQLSSLNHRDLYILVEKLEEAEQFTGDAHVVSEASKSTDNLVVARRVVLDELGGVLDHF